MAAGSNTHEAYEVEILRDATTQRIIEESWYRPAVPIKVGNQTLPEVGNRLHRIGGPAWVVYDRETGVATRELWYRDGRVHRDDGPAKILRDAETGRIKSSSWFQNGHRITPNPRPPARGRTAAFRHDIK